MGEISLIESFFLPLIGVVALPDKFVLDRPDLPLELSILAFGIDFLVLDWVGLSKLFVLVFRTGEKIAGEFVDFLDSDFLDSDLNVSENYYTGERADLGDKTSVFSSLPV